MSDITESPSPTKRKYTRKVKLTPRPPKPEVSIFKGMGDGGFPCAESCTPQRCEITWTNSCGSPLAGGPRADLMGNAGVIKRLNEAKAYLAHKAVDKPKR